MGRTRSARRLFVISLLVVCVATASVASAGEFSYRSGDLPYEPFSLARGEDIPERLLEQLAEKAHVSLTIAKRFSCTEKIYRDDQRVKTFDYLLGKTGRRDIEAVRFKEGGRRRAGFADSFPPAFAWSLLFSRTNQTLFMYRYLDETIDDFDLTHRIAFRGSLSFRKGTDLREWEGVVVVHSRSLEILRVEAVPRNYARVLEVKRARYLRSFKIGFFGYPIRFRRAPRVQMLEVEFAEVPLEEGALSKASEPEAVVANLPQALVWRDYKINAGGQLVRKTTEERRYLGYRFFEAGTRDLEYGGSADRDSR
jgi:hypothetical protein